MNDCPDRKNCPANHKPWPTRGNPAVLPPVGCQCGKPLWIVIPPGGHIHPCPVHPDRIVYGPHVIYW